MLKTITFTWPGTSTRRSMPKLWLFGLKKFSSRYKEALGVGVEVTEPVGVKVKVMVGVLVMVGVKVKVGVMVGE